MKNQSDCPSWVCDIKVGIYGFPAFLPQKCRMLYNEYREQGLFVGSGVIEAGCKTVIGHRLKQSGMKWSVRGANSIISLRCLYHSNRIEDFWEADTG